MLQQNRLADCIDDVNQFGLVRAWGFLNDSQEFVELVLNRECHRPAWPQSFVTPRYGQLNILGIKISPSDNDQVFKAAGNKNLILMKKPQISSAKEGALPGVF